MKKKRVILIISAVVLVVTLMVLGYLSSGLIDPKNQVWGNNLTAYSYVSSGKTYDWQTTMRSDLSNSTKKTYRSIIGKGKKYTVLPAWGISNTEKVKDVTVDGQEIDEVIAFSHDGTDYYLWIIYDLQTENAAVDIVIE